MMVRKLCLVSLLAVAACSYGTTAPKDVTLGQPIQLGIDEAARVPGADVTVRLVSIGDSRCPSDVTCVQAGDAAVLLTFSGNGSRSETLYLRTQPTSTTYGSYTFQLVDVSPYPKTTNPRPNLVATLKVTK
ncbi:MAG: hypothetical protein V4550_17430 [Gemmatimonadota bacterium]